MRRSTLAAEVWLTTFQHEVIDNTPCFSTQHGISWPTIVWEADSGLSMHLGTTAAESPYAIAVYRHAKARSLSRDMRWTGVHLPLHSTQSVGESQVQRQLSILPQTRRVFMEPTHHPLDGGSVAQSLGLWSSLAIEYYSALHRTMIHSC